MPFGPLPISMTAPIEFLSDFPKGPILSVSKFHDQPDNFHFGGMSFQTPLGDALTEHGIWKSVVVAGSSPAFVATHPGFSKPP